MSAEPCRKSLGLVAEAWGWWVLSSGPTSFRIRRYRKDSEMAEEEQRPAAAVRLRSRVRTSHPRRSLVGGEGPVVGEAHKHSGLVLKTAA